MFTCRTAFLCFLAAFSLSAPLSAKDKPAKTPEPTQTQILFEPGPLYPAHGGPGIKVAFIQNNAAMLMGGRGGMLLSDSWGLGFGGYSLASELLVQSGGVTKDLGIGYFGVVVDHSFYSRRLFYLNVDLLVGIGQAWSVARMPTAHRDYVSFFVLEPELNWMLNVTREFRIGLGVSARMAVGNDIHSVLGTDLPGFAATLTLWYGKL